MRRSNVPAFPALRDPCLNHRNKFGNVATEAQAWGSLVKGDEIVSLSWYETGLEWTILLLKNYFD
jgi:hypothetical protein